MEFIIGRFRYRDRFLQLEHHIQNGLVNFIQHITWMDVHDGYLTSIRFNSVGCLPEILTECSKLNVVDICNSAVLNTNVEFSKINHIKYMILRACEFKSFDDNLFSTFTNLDGISIYQVRGSKDWLDDKLNLFYSCPRLTSINISHIPISRFPLFNIKNYTGIDMKLRIRVRYSDISMSTIKRTYSEYSMFFGQIAMKKANVEFDILQENNNQILPKPPVRYGSFTDETCQYKFKLKEIPDFAQMT